MVLEEKQDTGSRLCLKWHIPKSILNIFFFSIPHSSDSSASQKLVYEVLQIFLERQPRASSMRLSISTQFSTFHLAWVCLFVCLSNGSDMIPFI